MIDLRYHIYSLVAVFIALFVGALFGLSISGGPGGRAEVIKTQGEAISRLNEQFKSYSEKLSRKQSRLDQLMEDLRDSDTLLAGMTPQIVKGALTGKPAAVITINANDDLVELISKTLTQSGSSVQSITRINPGFGAGDAGRMKEAAARLPLASQPTDLAPYEQVWAYIADTLAKGKKGSPFESLQAVGLLKADKDYSKPVRLAVIIASRGDNQEKEVDILVRPMLKGLKSSGLSAVLALPMDKSDGHNGDPWQNLDIPYIGHADLSAGQICLVMALAEGKGKYGSFGEGDFLPGRLLSR